MNTIRWTTAACVLGVAGVLAIAACGSGSGPPAGSPQALYVDLGCAKCHGVEREGLRSGPPLQNLSDRWDEEGLMAYLRDPETFVASNPRLTYMNEQFPIAMPAYANTPDEELRAVVGLILGG
jgi:cytochrome c551/c552